MTGRTHLLDPEFTHLGRTYCGLAGSSPVTADPGEATCKICLKWRRKLDQERAARETARQVPD